MFAAEWRWQGVWNSFPFLAWDLSMHPRTRIWFFNQLICSGACACSSNLNYAQKCIETHLMHKNVQTNREKFQNLTQHSCCSMLTLEFFWKQSEAMDIVSSPKGHVPYRNHHAWCEKLWFVRSLYPNLPQIGQKNYPGMLMPLHDSMPSFMNFRRVLDLLEFKNQVSQCLRPSDAGRVFEIHSRLLNGA